MGEINSDDHYIYCCGQKSLKRNGLVLIVNKKVQNVVLGCSLKKDSLPPQKKPLIFAGTEEHPDNKGWEPLWVRPTFV